MGCPTCMTKAWGRLDGNGIIAGGVISVFLVRVLMRQAAVSLASTAVQPCQDGVIAKFSIRDFLDAQGSLRALRTKATGAPKIVVSVQHCSIPPMPKAAAAKKTDQPASYEAALQELEQLIAQIESGQLPLEQMLSGYQRAAQLLGFCRSQLDAVQEQVKVLDEGQLSAWTQD